MCLSKIAIMHGTIVIPKLVVTFPKMGDYDNVAIWEGWASPPMRATLIN